MMQQLQKNIAASKYSLPHDPKESFAERTILITGSNTGLGLETAKKFAQLGAKKLILAVRNLEKGERAKREVLQCAPGKIDVEVWELDMSAFLSVRAFAKRVEHDLHDQSLDIAVLNAGVTFLNPHTSPEGWAQEIQVNTLSTVLLAILLLPKLRASQTKEFTPILTFTSSSTHKFVPTSTFELPADAPKTKTPFLSYWSQLKVWPGGRAMYAMTKLLLEFAIQVLANHPLVQEAGTKKINVIVNSSCPGYVATELGRDYTGSSALFKVVVFFMFRLWSRNAEQGSRTIVSATTLGKNGHGQFWQNDEIVTEDRGLMSSPERDVLQARVWEEIMTVLTKAAPEVREILGPKSAEANE